MNCKEILQADLDISIVIRVHSIIEGIEWKHWPDILEFITRSAEFWNRWIRL